MSAPYASKKSIKIGFKDLKLFTMGQNSVPKIQGRANTCQYATSEEVAALEKDRKRETSVDNSQKQIWHCSAVHTLALALFPPFPYPVGQHSVTYPLCPCAHDKSCWPSAP